MTLWTAFACGAPESLAHRLLWGPAPPCTVDLPVRETGDPGERVGAWCVDDRRGLVDAVLFLDPTHLLVVSNEDGATVLDLRTGAHTPWPGTVGARSATLLPNGGVAVGYDDGRLEVREAGGGLSSGTAGLGPVRAILAAEDGSLLTISVNGVTAHIEGHTIQGRRTGDGDWCMARAGDGSVWACGEHRMTELGRDLAPTRTVDLPIERPWSASTDAAGRIWVVGDPDGVAVLDASGVNPIRVQASGTLRAVSPMPRGAAIASWGGVLYYVDDAGPFATIALGPGRAQSVTTSADGRIVAVGRDFGQIDLRVAATPAP